VLRGSVGGRQGNWFGGGYTNWQPAAQLWAVREEEAEFEVPRRRLRESLESMVKDVEQYPQLGEPAPKALLEKISVDQLFEISYNSVRELFNEWIDEEELEWDDGIMHDTESSDTYYPEAYVWQTGTHSHLLPTVRNSGAAWCWVGLHG